MFNSCLNTSPACTAETVQFPKRNLSAGFSLVELIAVLVIVAVLAGVTASRWLPSSLLELQAARGQLTNALFHAQQLALLSPYDVRLTTLAGAIDIRIDSNDDGLYSTAESASFGGLSYPITLLAGAQLSSHTLYYSRLGETSAQTINLTLAERSASVQVSAMGMAH